MIHWLLPRQSSMRGRCGKELAAVAGSANSLSDGYPRRTILDVEPEFAQAAESLFLESEFFEDALEAARSRAEARAKAIDG